MHSFYYWKTTFTHNTADSTFLQKNKIGHFYIRYFDVDYSYNERRPVPGGELNVNNATSFLLGQYTPVVFITNTTFIKLYNFTVDSLAVKIRNRILFINHKISKARAAEGIAEGGNDPAEIQIDCDWTEQTKNIYFDFLRKLKLLFPGKIISATIRLYPYKYRTKMGVPPADKGLLMCYNLSNIKLESNSNSVFKIKDLEQYLVAPGNYRLPLDIALPVFGWYAWFSNGKYKGIVYPDEGISPVLDTIDFKINGNNLQVVNDIEFNSQYLRQGDLLRAEYPKPQELIDAAILLHKKFPITSRIAFFYYDNALIKRYETAIEKVYSLY